MVAFYKSQGQNLGQVLTGIYEKFGYYAAAQKSLTCEGQSGMAQIASIMDRLHNSDISELGGMKVVKTSDYLLSVTKDKLTGKETEITLPKSNVLSFTFEDDSYIIVRPSGTEPKIKLYLGAVGENEKAAEEKLALLEDIGTKTLGF